MRGRVVREARGSGGFGYDVVFEADEAPGVTTAELTPADKDAISHRGKALREIGPLIARRCATGCPGQPPDREHLEGQVARRAPSARRGRARRCRRSPGRSRWRARSRSVVLTSVQAVPVVRTATRPRPSTARLTKKPEPRPRNPSSFSRSVQTVARASSTRPTTHSTNGDGHEQREQLGGEEATDGADRRGEGRRSGAATVGAGVPAASLTSSPGPPRRSSASRTATSVGSTPRAVWQVLGDVGLELAGLVDGEPSRLLTQPREVVAHQRVVGSGHHVVSLVVGSVVVVGACRRIDSTALLNSAQATRKSWRARWPSRVSA